MNHFKRIALLPPALLLCICFVRAQTEFRPFYHPDWIVSVFNAGTLLPGSGFITTPLHPGVSAGAEFPYNMSLKNRWFQTARLGVSYHQYVQTSVQIYSEAGYRRSIWQGTAIEMRLGAGYLHAFSNTAVFKLKDGVYKQKTNLGRPQLMASSAVGLSYRSPKKTDAPRFFLDYQFFLQLPFVKSYVPLLPNTALHVGVAFPFSLFKHNSHEK